MPKFRSLVPKPRSNQKSISTNTKRKLRNKSPAGTMLSASTENGTRGVSETVKRDKFSEIMQSLNTIEHHMRAP